MPTFPENALAAVVLAAGLSRRYGPENKLLADFNGKPLIAHALAHLAQAGLDAVVVTGPDHAGLTNCFPYTGVEHVINQRPGDGMGRSIAVGVSAARAGRDGLFICLGDMPLVDAQVFAKLAAAFKPGESDVVMPVHDGRRGHPVLFAASCFDTLASLDGDQGARNVIAKASKVVEVPAATDAIFRDIDTPEDFTG